MTKPITLSYYSDLLCVWAYVSQIRLDELQKNFNEQLEIEHHFITIFGDTERRISKDWSQQGGFEGFASHVQTIGKDFPHAKLNSAIWKQCRPKTCANSHLFIKAVQLLKNLNQLKSSKLPGNDQDFVSKFIWRVRCAFFQQAKDIGNLKVLYEIAEDFNLPLDKIADKLNDGSAMAALMQDMAQKVRFNIEGSPTYLLNQGRQKLYGNVGYRVIEANVTELLNHPEGQASWC